MGRPVGTWVRGAGASDARLAASDAFGPGGPAANPAGRGMDLGSSVGEDGRRFAAARPAAAADVGDVVYGGGVAGSEGPSLSRTTEYTPSRTGNIVLQSAFEGGKFVCVRGPVGNGKSVLMCWKIWAFARSQVRQWVVERDGTRHVVRWSKFLVARHTFKALDETTVETWNQWFGDRTRWTTNPYEGRFEEPMEDGSLVRIDFVCYATESRNIMNDLQSLELSGAWLNEATQMRYEVVARVYSRLKRFNPVPQNRAPMKTFPVLMDTNSPDETNWWYRKEVVERPQGWVFVVCPPAILLERDPATGRKRYVANDPAHAKARGIHPMENVRQFDGGFHDGVGYWTDQLDVLGDDEIRTLLMNEFGTSVAGMPVYAEWNDQVHCVRGGIEPERGMSLVVGMDLGRRPAAVIAQMRRDGVLCAMREVTTWNERMNNGRGGLESMDVVTFFQSRLRPALVEYGYPRTRHVVFADPAGENCTETSSISAIDHLRAEGLNIVSCDKVLANAADSRDVRKANDVNIRLGCVSRALRTMRYGTPEVQVSDRCEMLRKGFNGRYCFRRMRAGGDGSERYEDRPDKNDYSHIHDAFQYLCIGVFLGAQDYSRPAGEDGGGWGSDYDYISPEFDYGLV